MTEALENSEPIMVEESEDPTTLELYEGLEQIIVDKSEGNPEVEVSEDLENLVKMIQDLASESNEDPKSVELLDLPMKLICEILSKVDVKERSVVRSVCRRFRDAADHYIDTIALFHHHGMAQLQINDKLKDYRPATRLEEAFSVLAPRIQKSKQIGLMRLLSSTQRASESFISKLAQLDGSLNVRKLAIHGDSTKSVVSMLQCFNAEVLEQLLLVHLYQRKGQPLIGLELFETDQFKNAKAINTELLGTIGTSDLKKFYNFEAIQVKVDYIGKETTLAIIEAFRKSSNARTWQFRSENFLEITENFRNSLGELIDEEVDVYCRDPMRRFRLRIPDSNKTMFFIQHIFRFAISTRLIELDELSGWKK